MTNGFYNDVVEQQELKPEASSIFSHGTSAFMGDVVGFTEFLSGIFKATATEVCLVIGPSVSFT
jgi:hypothetical protein